MPMIAISWGNPECVAECQPPPATKIGQIIRQVARKHGITVIDIKSARRERYVAWARQEVMWRCKQETLHSLPEIGRVLRRDHTTVLHGIRAHELRMGAAGG